jgi:hypothetical protein
VPFLVRFPGVQGNRIETRLVSNVDVVPTIADFIGLAPWWPMDGRSMIPLLDNPDLHWIEEMLIEKHPDGKTDFGYYGILVPRWSYVHYMALQQRDAKKGKPPLMVFTSERELYDLEADPWQLENLANRPECQPERAAVSECAAMRVYLEARLEARLEGEGPPTPTPTPTFSPTPTTVPTDTPSPTATPVPTDTAEPTVTDTATPTNTATPTETATPTPTLEPTATDTAEPTVTDTAEPTVTVTVEPTVTDTIEPTATDTVEPAATETPTPIP